jgi:hypothetical protein
MQPTSILGDVRGFARDYALDQLPRGYIWDLVDYIPRRRGARLDGRGPWPFLSPSSLGGAIWGGYHAPFRAGTNLLVATNPALYDVNVSSGSAASVGTLFATGKHNGVMLSDRVFFADGTGAQRPKYVTRSGATLSLGQLTSGPPATVLGAHKGRLVSAGDPAKPYRVSFSPLETKGGPPGTWDAVSFFDTDEAITMLWPMGGQILVFHNGSIEKLRGAIPAEATVDSDFYLDPFTQQVGCNDPASVVGWQENVIWAAPRGIYLSDGSTMRSLTEQGGISDLWRQLYANKRAGTQVTAVVFLDLLFVSVLIDWDGSTPHDLRPFTLVCHLTDRSWYRFANVGMTAAIPSQIDGEEVWWGADGWGHELQNQNRLAKLSPTLFIERDPIDLRSPEQFDLAPANAIDGNGVPVLPQAETGWTRLGEEGVKRIRSIHVSHTTLQVPPSPTTKLLRVSYRMRPWPFTPYTMIGEIPGKDDYKRHRIPLGKRGYGVAIKVEQILPSYLSRLHDIAVEEWAHDRSHL